MCSEKVKDWCIKPFQFLKLVLGKGPKKNMDGHTMGGRGSRGQPVRAQTSLCNIFQLGEGRYEHAHIFNGFFWTLPLAMLTLWTASSCTSKKLQF